MNWLNKAIEMQYNNKSWDLIIDEMRLYSEFQQLSDRQIYEKVRKAIFRAKRNKPTNGECNQKDTTVGVIGDTHIPFEHPGYLQFCIDTFKKHNVKRVVHIGDVFDHYCYSRFIKKPISLNPEQERELSKQKVAPWTKAFPNLDWVLGNHDWRLLEFLENAGIDTGIVKGFRDIYDLPKTWNIYDEFDNLLVIDDVLYLHGSAYGGQLGARTAAVNEQMSVVTGHAHPNASIFWIANKRKLMFGMNVGWGGDNSKYSFAYNKKDKTKPILSCGIVHNSKQAEIITMDQEYFDIKE